MSYDEETHRSLKLSFTDAGTDSASEITITASRNTEGFEWKWKRLWRALYILSNLVLLCIGSLCVIGGFSEAGITGWWEVDWTTGLLICLVTITAIFFCIAAIGGLVHTKKPIFLKFFIVIYLFSASIAITVTGIVVAASGGLNPIDGDVQSAWATTSHESPSKICSLERAMKCTGWASPCTGVVSGLSKEEPGCPSNCTYTNHKTCSERVSQLRPYAIGATAAMFICCLTAGQYTHLLLLSVAS
eukprot:TRINITY_DN6501_c0_g2_i1.p1 TRINITY_DN6501_c0_g2~~TRINITY_DN6501_c0_g2_i1.p1  ORF type:complete len:245 (+),score=19.29 TRINITY_DN6501_c0_g2_i1:67-801(+)